MRIEAVDVVVALEAAEVASMTTRTIGADDNAFDTTACVRAIRIEAPTVGVPLADEARLRTIMRDALATGTDFVTAARDVTTPLLAMANATAFCVADVVVTTTRATPVTEPATAVGMKYAS